MQLQEVLQSDHQWGDELERLQEEFSAEAARQEAENQALQGAAAALRREVAVLRDSTLVGEKQRQLDAAEQRLQAGGRLLDEVRAELEAVSSDKKQLAERLLSYDENMDQQVSE
jgi:hypothetical protein